MGFQWDKDFTRFKGLILFALIIVGFHLLYKLYEPNIISILIVVHINTFLIQNLLESCSWVLNVFGLTNSISGDTITLINGFQIQMQFGCSGFQQFLLVLILFVLFPGPWKVKLWFIPLAILFVHILNIARFAGLSIYFSHFKDHYHLIHDWIFRPFIFFGIFVTWIMWVEYIIKKKPESDNSGLNQKNKKPIS